MFGFYTAAKSFVKTGEFTDDDINLKLTSYDGPPLSISSDDPGLGEKSLVRVTHLPHSMSRDKLRDFIENKRKSNGGPVKSLEMREGSTSAVICFENQQG